MFVFFFLTYFPLVSPQTQQTCPLCAVSSAWNAVLLANSLTSVISSITFYVSFLKQYLCLSTSHGWRSLVGYSPWGGKESDTIERLNTLCNYWIYCVYCFLFVSFLLLPTRVLVLFALRTMPGTSYCSVNICGMNEFPDEEISIHFFYSDCLTAELFSTTMC